MLFEAFLWIPLYWREVQGHYRQPQFIIGHGSPTQMAYCRTAASIIVYTLVYMGILWLVWFISCIPSWVHYRVRVSELDQIQLSKITFSKQ